MLYFDEFFFPEGKTDQSYVPARRVRLASLMLRGKKALFRRKKNSSNHRMIIKSRKQKKKKLKLLRIGQIDSFIFDVYYVSTSAFG